jgi:hypothetical protein
MRIKFIISTKLRTHSVEGVSHDDITNWREQISIVNILHYLKQNVAHGSLTDDQIVQNALEKCVFTINANDETSIDAITIRFTRHLITDTPSNLRTSKHQKVMVSSLLSKLQRTKPPLFAAECYNNLNPKKAKMSHVQEFLDQFNQFACNLIRECLRSDKFAIERGIIQRDNNNNVNPNKRVKGNNKPWNKSTLEEGQVPTTSTVPPLKTLCTGCGRPHGGECRGKYKTEYNPDPTKPYKTSAAGLKAAARRATSGLPYLGALDLGYKPPGEAPDPTDAPWGEKKKKKKKKRRLLLQQRRWWTWRS